MIHSFLLNQTEEINKYYEENGYVVVKDAIPSAQIDGFIENYEVFKAAKSYYFRSQDTNRAEQLQVNNEGFIERSILDPTDLLFQKNFTQSVSNIIYSTVISGLLSLLSGCEKHIVWQSMFFDKSTGTVPHQDHYYLDSNPPGHLVASWFALEDIHEDAGTFFVVPGSHKGPLVEGKPGATNFSDHEEYVENIQQLIAQENYQFQSMPLSKGSVLLWHPFLVHGAFKNVNPQYSRKSFTAHYLPLSYGRFCDCLQNGKNKTDPTIVTSNQNILVWKKSLAEQVKNYLRYVRYWAQVKSRKPSDRPQMEMRSSQY